MDRTTDTNGVDAAFWHRQLDDALPLLGFPGDHRRVAHLSASDAVVSVPIEPQLAGRLRALAADLAAGIDELFLAAYQVFLFRHAGQQDIVVGWPFAAGDFTLPLRQQLEPTEPFAALVARNRQLRDTVASHQGRPLAAIVEMLAIERSGSHAPLFQHALRFAGVAAPGGSIGALDTCLELADTDTGLQAAIRYNTCLFDAESAERWARNLGTLLDAICTGPTDPVGELSLLHPRELAFVASSLDQTGVPFEPRYPSVHAGFAQQVLKTPQAVAVRCGATAWTYAELDGRANAIAQHLRDLGVGRDDLVGICTDRDNDMIAAVIGVLKLGSAYVPMDPKYPVLRLASIVAEARLNHVVCDERGSGLVGEGVHKVRLGDVPACQAAFEPAPPDLESLSHVIFTSGSTGRPKGVMARHRNVLAFLEWIWAHYTPRELAVTLCCSSLCFDLTVFEIWGPLTTGGQIVVVENAAALVQAPHEGLTLINTVPTALRLLVDEMALPRSVRTINVCGEPLDGQLVADLFESRPDVVFYNTYGPTEDTAYSTFFKMTGPYAGDPPIGAPLVHEFGRVVDATGRSVPVGVVGELLIGGAGVARGYVNNPDQTAERFVVSSDHAGRDATVYRTGDFVRLRNDGQLHFVGRRDDQIKLRGFRIDLGDVVNALQHMPGITDARVLVRGHKTGDVLVAYLSHEAMTAGVPAPPALIARVEAEARARLPSFMVPAYFILFAKLPLNENGKVDRQALAAIELDPTPTTAAHRQASEDERAIAEIWKVILEVDAVAPDDDFFLIGGNSLLAVRMVSRLNKRFGTTVPTQAVFEDRTPALLATRVRREAVVESVPLVRVDATAGVRPTYQQMAMLADPSKTAFNLASAMRIVGPLDVPALRRALQALVRRHDAMRLRFAIAGMDMRMHVAEEAPDILQVMALEAGDAAIEPRLEAAIAHEWRAPFDLRNDPPVRALLLRAGPDDHVFMLSIHHVVTDEWSRNLLKRDLGQLYAAELGSTPATAEPLPFRYVDFADWLGRSNDTDAYRRQLMYWAAELREIHVDGSFPLSTGGRAPAPATQHLRLVVPPGLPQQLQSLSTRHGYTRYVVFMAALQLALAEFSGLEQQVVWSPVARRPHPDLEDAVGLYTNLVAISARADPQLTLAGFAALIDAKVARARANSDVSALTAVMMDPSLMPALPMFGLNVIDLPNERPWAFSGTTVRPIELRLEDEADLCVLEMTAHVDADGLRMGLAYQPAVLGAADVQRIVASFWAMVGRLEQTPGLRLAEVLPAASESAWSPTTAPA